jgi:RsiW-degrading membrane proteinase PrsW (M82 family)
VTDPAPHSELQVGAAAPPRKWLGRKGGWVILGGFAVVWLYVLLFDTLVEHQTAPSPTAIILGGFALASALIYTMAYRLDPSGGLSLSRLLLAFLLGGLLSTVVAASINWLIDQATGGTVLRPSLTALSLAGVVEELCKILAVVVVSRKLANKTARNGLFIGGAVGLGFSAIEDMSYQLRGWDTEPFFHSHLASIISIAVSRDLIGPLEHPIFTAMFAAALFAATRNGRYRITPMLVGVYVAIAAVHGAIDSAGAWIGLATGLPGFAALLGFVIGIGLAVASGIVWLRVSRRIRDAQLAAPPEVIPAAYPLEPPG